MAVELSDNVYAHALGLVDSRMDFMYPDLDLPQGVSGGSLPPYGGASRKHRRIHMDRTHMVGSGFFDDLLRSGKRVFHSIAPAIGEVGKQLLHQGIEHGVDALSNAISGLGQPGHHAGDRPLPAASRTLYPRY